jgi:predicted dehydrogenase
MAEPFSFSSASRRQFLQASAVTAAGQLALSSSAYAAGADEIKVGMVGCGGRGTGAAVQALKADKGARLVAMGDAFGDRLESSLGSLKNPGNGVAEQVAVDSDHKFVGFDAYQKVIDAGVDVVLLTAPPCFRPKHIAAAVEAGKHIFAEKPIAVDAAGVRSVMETCAKAKEKNLSVVSGLCWRYHNGMRAMFDAIHAGGVGEIQTMQLTYLTGTLKQFPRQEGWSDMEWQMRNWQHFLWSSGDFNVEQHIHSLDKGLWAMKDEAPVKCTGVGGRQARTGPESGNVYDHFCVVYEWANGAKAFAACRQMDGCSNDVSDHVYGTKGVANVFQHRIKGETDWKFKGEGGDMYQIEHNELFASVRSGKPINNGDYMCKSSLMAIMGRQSAYTGKTITWEQALNSKEDLVPAKLEWTSMPVAPVPTPGVTQFV